MIRLENEDERRERSEAARRAAIKERINRQKEREKQIALDIANVDKKATKRIVFENSDDEEAEQNTPSSSNKNGKPQLFESDGEDDDQKNEEDLLAIANRHSGAKGAKLMKLESRFNSDPRFKLSDKFVESDESDDECEDDSKQESTQEKMMNRKLLSIVLGKEIKEDKRPNKSTDGVSARPFTRFDPENEEHVKWMESFVESKKKKAQNYDKRKKDNVEEEDEEEEEEEGANKNEIEDQVEKMKEGDDDDDDNFQKTEIFFKLDDTFSKELKKKATDNSNESFSFLKMMGRNHKGVEEDEAEEEENEHEDKKEEKKEKSIEIVEAKLSTTTTTLPKTLRLLGNGRFFVNAKDEQVASMASNFRRTQDSQKIVDKWASHRDAIFKIWKKQRRNVLKIEKNSFFDDKKNRKRRNEESEKVEIINEIE